MFKHPQHPLLDMPLIINIIIVPFESVTIEIENVILMMSNTLSSRRNGTNYSIVQVNVTN